MSLSCLELAADRSNPVMELIKIPPGVLVLSAFCLVGRSHRLRDGPFASGENVLGLITLFCLIALLVAPMVVRESGLLRFAEKVGQCGQQLQAAGLYGQRELLNADLEPVPCTVLVFGALHKLWAFLMSDDGHIFFAAAATGKAILYYRGRSPLPEAKHFGDVLITGLLLSLLIIVTDSPIKDLLASVQCEAPRSHLHLIAPRG